VRGLAALALAALALAAAPGRAVAGNAQLQYTLVESGDTGDFAATPACTTTCTLAAGGTANHSVVFSPQAYDFGTLCVGQSTATRFTVTSTGSADIELSLPVLADTSGAFDLAMIDPVPDDYPAMLAPTSTATFDVVVMPPAPDLMVAVQGALQWTVVFEPERLGEHNATLELTTSAGMMSVPLVGVGESASGDGGGNDGGAGLETTSYYACDCRGSADPGGAAPLVLVVVFLLSSGRRRRRSRSRRCR